MEEIDLKELFNMFWSNKLLIVLIIVMFTLLGFFYTKYMVKPDYKSTSTVVLTKATDNETITQTEVTLNQRLVATYTELIRSKTVIRQVISNLNAEIDEEQLKNSVSVSLVNNTQLIEIAVTNENPELAQIFTNEITKVFIEKVKEIYKIDNITIYYEAKVPLEPYNINHIKDIMMFAIIGIIVAFGLVFVLSLFDTTIKSAEEVEKRLGLSVLASIPNYDYEAKKKGKK